MRESMAEIMSRTLQSTHGCGDLIFSSHTTFALVGVMSYQEYGTLTPVKVNIKPCRNLVVARKVK